MSAAFFKISRSISNSRTRLRRAKASRSESELCSKTSRFADKSGQGVHHSTGWRALKRLGFSLQTPRPRNKRRASLGEQAEFKKSWNGLSRLSKKSTPMSRSEE